MNGTLVMKWNENVLWLSVLLLIYLGFVIDQHYLITLVFWVIIILSVGNAKRFYSDKYFNLSTIIRRSLYVFPFYIPMLFGYNPAFQSEDLFVFSLLGIFLGLLLILPKWNEWKIALSKDMIEFSRKQKRIEYFTEFYMLIGAAIGEELFFRNFIIGNIQNSSYLLAIIFSSALFFLNHFGVKWYDSFKLYDYMIQIVFGFLSAILFILSNSIIPCILMHIIYNFPLLLLSIKRYRFHYLNKKKPIPNTLEKEI
jgi:membrane protease YdiL (CAAX protease family)